SCDMKGKAEIISAIENRLNIKLGQTSPDKKFSLLEANCLGWCHKGPAMIINDKAYTELTPEKVIAAIEENL
ncbi:MAG TPA: NAD(P)H-dependent oxidoreductase subunit E, partial [bacterium]|nr:NAD(P)H-dependent oxidoreductase subunit E [bacterium]